MKRSISNRIICCFFAFIMLCEFVNVKNFKVFAENTNKILNVCIYNCSGVALDLLIEACDSSNCTFVNSQNELLDSRIITSMMDGSNFNFSLISSSNYELFRIEADEADSRFLFTRDSIEQYCIKDDESNKTKQIALYYTPECVFINKETYEEVYGVIDDMSFSEPEVNETTYNDKIVSYSYSGVTGNKEYKCNYNPNVFFGDEVSLSPELAKITVALAMSAYNIKEVKSVLESMNFNFMPYNYDVEPTYEDNDRVAFSVGHAVIADPKTLEKYSIYLVPIRGTKSNCEWFSNFNLGQGDYHEGFWTASYKVIKQLNQILNNNGFDKEHTKILFTGHSRGAAVANMVSAYYIKNESKYVSPKNVYGYTFACPAVTKDYNEYNIKTIHNFNNPGDNIAAIPLESWGFGRYGVDHTFEYGDDYFDNFIYQFKRINGVLYNGLADTSALIETLRVMAGNQEEFNQPRNRFWFNVLAMFLGSDADERVEILGKIIKDSDYIADISKEKTNDILLNLLLGKASKYLALAKMTVSAVSIIAEGSTFEVNEYCQKTMNLLNSITSAINNTRGMTDEEFQEWRKTPEAITLVSEIESSTYLEVQSRNDLLKAEEEIRASLESVSDMIPDIQSVVNLFYVLSDGFHDIKGTLGNGADSISHSHTGETYILWINSIYFGCDGWRNNPNIKEMTVPISITSIDKSCFEGSTIEKITLPDNLISISPFVFYNCKKLYSINIPEMVNRIKDSAFKECISLTSIVIPDSVTYIEDRAFYGCTALEKLSVPCDVDYNSCLYTSFVNYNNYYPIDDTYPFDKCDNLSEIHFTHGHTGIMPDSHLDNFNGMARDRYQLIQICCKKTLKKVYIEDGITYLGNYSFYGNNRIEEVHISNTVVEIANHCFEGCSSLQSITIPESVKALGEKCFASCGLYNVLIPETITRISNGCFSNNLFECFTIPDHVSELCFGCFQNCKNLKNVILPNSIKAIPGSCFDGCSALEKLVIPDSVSTLGNRAIANCPNITLLQMPVDITYVSGLNSHIYGSSYYIDNNTFMGTENIKKLVLTCGHNNEMSPTMRKWVHNLFDISKSIKEITFTEGVKTINEGFLSGYSGIEEINLPSTITSIGSNAFNNCKNMKTIKYNGTCIDWKNVLVGSNNNNINIHTLKFTNGHNLNHIETIEPTCIKDGKKVYTCDICEETLTDVLPALGHSYGDGIIVPSTCTEKGYTLHKCSVCGDEYKDTATNATGHKYTSKVTKPATCMTDGVKTFTCTACKDSYTETIKATGHKYVDTVIAPTTTEQGCTHHKCSVCGDEYDDSFVDPIQEEAITFDIILNANDKAMSSENVNISINGEEASTSDNGSVELSLADGTHEITFSAHGFVPRTYTVEVKNGKLTEELTPELNLIGDADGNGVVNTLDIVKLKRHLIKVEPLTGYAFDCANTDGNDTLNTLDIVKLKRHLINVEKLW